MFLLVHLQNLKNGTTASENFTHDNLKAAKAQAFQMCAYDTSVDTILSYHVVIFDNMMREVKRYEDILTEPIEQ